MVATNGPTNAMWDSLFRLMGANDVEVCGMAALGYGQDWDEEHGTSPGYCSHSLCQVVDLASVCLCHTGPSKLFLSSIYLASSPMSGLKALPQKAVC